MGKEILFILLFVLIAAALLVGLVIILLNIREKGTISDTFFQSLISQIISGIIIALVSFSSAYGLWKIQEARKDRKAKEAEEQRITDIRMDSFIKIANEVSENRLTLGQDIKNNAFVRIPLKTTAWEQGKYQTPVKTELLLDGLKLLYDDIEKYNWHVRFIQYKVMAEKLTKDNLPDIAKEAQGKIDQDLFDKLEKFESLTSRELVIIEQKKKDDHVSRFGAWQEKVEIPYFKKVDENKSK